MRGDLGALQYGATPDANTVFDDDSRSDGDVGTDPTVGTDFRRWILRAEKIRNLN